MSKVGKKPMERLEPRKQQQAGAPYWATKFLTSLARSAQEEPGFSILLSWKCILFLISKVVRITPGGRLTLRAPQGSKSKRKKTSVTAFVFP